MVDVICEECGVTFKARPAAKRKLCGLKCHGARKSKIYHGENNPKWRGGRITEKDGRVAVYAPGHPGANLYGGTHIYEYRLVAEKKIGRPLLSTEIVHHRNHDPTDNLPGNLMVMTQSEHARLEMEERLRDPVSGQRIPTGARKKGSRWTARTKHGKKEIWLGSFGSKNEAHEAVRKYRMENAL